MDISEYVKHPESVYPSIRDRWLVVVLTIATLCQIGGGIVFLLAEGPFLFRFSLFLFMVLVAFFIQWVIWRTRYSLLQKMMLIECGPFHYRVKYADITAVEPTKNPLSSPALSLKRLHIHHRGHRFGIMISPVNQEEFLTELVSRDPGLERDGLIVKRHTEHDIAP